MEAYDDATQTWSVIGHLPCPMSHLAATGANVSTAGLTHTIAGLGGREGSSGGGGGGGNRRWSAPSGGGVGVGSGLRSSSPDMSG
jgi:hypothetical protein